MKKSDAKGFAKQMMILTEIYNDGKPLSKIRSEIYWQALQEFSVLEITEAVMFIAKNRVYPSFPKPAEIISAIMQKDADKPMLGWMELTRAVKTIGPYSSVKFEDPVIHSIVKVWGGWERIGLLTEKEWEWKQKEFMELYPILSRRGEHPERLIGIHESNNHLKYKEHIEPTVLIGGKNNQLQIEN